MTIEQGTGTVLAIRRNWNPDDPLMLKRQHFVHYSYVPGFGFYGLGLIHIIGGYAKAGTSLIRQLVDAGTLSNLPGGLKSRGLRVKGDDTPIGPGEFRDVDVPSGSIKENIMTLPYKEPSQTLLALLKQITEEGRRLGAISDMNISDMSANAPVGTTLALLERTLKPMAAVQARVHYAMKQEFKLLRAIIAEYAPDEYMYTPDRAEARARRMDYDMVEVIPVSDPNSSTMAQRVVQYQTVLQMAQATPQIYDLPQLHRQMIEVLGIKNADKLVPTKEDIKPSDPVSENMAALIGKPMQSVYLPRPRRAYCYAPSLPARPADCGVYWTKPSCTAGGGCPSGAHSRAHRLQLQTADGSKTGGTTASSGRRNARRDRRSFFLRAWQKLGSSGCPAESKQAAQAAATSNKRKTRCSNCNSKNCSLRPLNNSAKPRKIRQMPHLTLLNCNLTKKRQTIPPLLRPHVLLLRQTKLTQDKTWMKPKRSLILRKRNKRLEVTTTIQSPMRDTRPKRKDISLKMWRKKQSYVLSLQQRRT